MDDKELERKTKLGYFAAAFILGGFLAIPAAWFTTLLFPFLPFWPWFVAWWIVLGIWLY